MHCDKKILSRDTKIQKPISYRGCMYVNSPHFKHKFIQIFLAVMNYIGIQIEIRMKMSIINVLNDMLQIKTK